MARYFKAHIGWMLFAAFFMLHALFFISCQEGGDAGDLLGQWRMKGSDTQYLNFSGKIALFRDNRGNQVFGNFQRVSDSLFIQCCSIEGKQFDTLMVEKTFGFTPFTNIRVKIDVLDSENLVLSKDSQKWSFYLY